MFFVLQMYQKKEDKNSIFQALEHSRFLQKKWGLLTKKTFINKLILQPFPRLKMILLFQKFI
jgi:hypothetical protein